MAILNTITKRILKEAYSEKLMSTMVDKFIKENPRANNEISRALINRFDQIKAGLSTKLNQIALPDRLKEKNKYLDITQYSFDELVKLIRSIPEDENKIKKEMAKFYAQQERMSENDTRAYVNRFFNNKRNLKQYVENGADEELGLSKQEIKEYIPRQLMMGENTYLDIRMWRNFHQLEQMLDALFPTSGLTGKEGDEQLNSATTDADKVYSKDGLEVYKGDAQHKCIAYNPKGETGTKYSWCIAQPGNSFYDNYRFRGQGENRMFYFVFDRTKSDKGNKGNFNDKWHAYVINVGEDKYWVTNANNPGELPSGGAKTWQGLESSMAPEAWDKIKNLESIFKYLPPSKAEITASALRGKKLSANDFRELDYDTKEDYVKANVNQLDKQILDILDDNLKSISIEMGQKYTFDNLKYNKKLVERYAFVRFRHTDWGKTPIPLPFINYLNEEQKKEYFEKYEKQYSRFDQILKYFGEGFTKYYVDKEAKNLNYLPREAEPFIKDTNILEKYDMMWYLWDKWEIFESDDYNVDQPKKQEVVPQPLTLNDWKGFKYKKLFLDLVKQNRSKIPNDSIDDTENYENAVLYSSPFILINGSKTFLVLPKDSGSENNTFYITDTEGNLVTKETFDENLIFNEDTYLNPTQFQTMDKIFNLKDIKYNDQPIKLNINESKYSLIDYKDLIM